MGCRDGVFRLLSETAEAGSQGGASIQVGPGRRPFTTPPPPPQASKPGGEKSKGLLVELALMRDVNDQPAHAEQLARLRSLRGLEPDIEDAKQRLKAKEEAEKGA